MMSLMAYKFYTDGCINCLALNPIVQEVERKSGIKFLGINAEQNEIAQEYNVRTVPTLLFLNNKFEEAGRIEGLKNEGYILDKIREMEE